MARIAYFLALALSATGAVRAASPFNWGSTKSLFSFGDSYTANGFDPKGVQPNAANYLGNPPYPGWTYPSGGNWLTQLTSKYNKTLTLTYNLAYGGATTDGDLIPPYSPTVLNLKDQVNSEFLPIYANATASTCVWQPKTTLFSYWIGVNDIGWTWWTNQGNQTAYYTSILTRYMSFVESTYTAGGRNFLFLNCPPTDLSPSGVASDPATIAAAIKIYNEVLASLVYKWSAKRRDAKVYIYDTNKLFRQVYSNPAAYGITNVTGYGSDVSYFWLDTLHPNTNVHFALAKDIAATVFGVKV